MVWHVLYWALGALSVLVLSAAIISARSETTDKSFLLGLEFPTEPWARAEINLWRRAKRHHRGARTILQGVSGLLTVAGWFLWPQWWPIGPQTMTPVLTVFIITNVLDYFVRHGPVRLRIWLVFGSPLCAAAVIVWAAALGYIPWPAALLIAPMPIGWVARLWAHRLRWRQIDRYDPLTRALGTRPVQADGPKRLPGNRAAWFQARAYSRRLTADQVSSIADHLTDGGPPDDQRIYWHRRLGDLAAELGIIRTSRLLDTPPKESILDGQSASLHITPERLLEMHAEHTGAREAVNQIAHTDPADLDAQHAELACVWHLDDAFGAIRKYRSRNGRWSEYYAHDVNVSDRDTYWAATKTPLTGPMPPA